MSTEPATLPDAPALDQWPPVAHIIHKKDMPAKEGTIALCGAKLMGLDLGRLNDAGNVCPKCVGAYSWNRASG